MRLAWLPVPLLLTILLLLWMLELPAVVVEPPYLLLVLNFTFRTAIGVFIAYLAARGFSRNGSLPVLGLGCGMLLFGTASLVSALAVNFGYFNLGLTVYNTGLCLSAACHLAAAVWTLTPAGRRVPKAGLVVSLVYACALLLVSLLTFAAIRGLTPVFFIQGEGPTPIRQVILLLTTSMFALASLLIAGKVRQRDWMFDRWYALSLALMAIGTLGIMMPTAVGAPISWVGRLAQYLGGLYMLGAALIAVRHAGNWDTALQDALEHSEERLRTLAEATFEGIVISENGVIIDTNDQLAHMLGYEREELLGKPIAPMIRPDFASLVKQRMESDAESFLEHALIRKDGTELLVEAHGRTLTRHGRKLRFTAIRDLTERKKQEQAVRDAHKRVAETLENISDGFVSLDRNWNYTYVNRAAAKGLKTSPEELIGQNFWDRWPLTQNMASGKALPQCMEENRPTRYTEYYPAPLDRWYDCYCYPAPDGVSLFFTDITERKRTEEALRQIQETNLRNLARLDAIVNQMTEGLVVFDPDGNLVQMNPAALEIHGVGSVDEIQKHLTELPDVFEIADLNGNLLPPERWPIGRVLQGETFRSYEVRVRLKSTGKSWIGSYGGAPVYDDKGKMLSAIVTLRDVTEQGLAEQALRESEQRFRTVVENSRDAIHQFDLVQDRYVFVSSSIEALFGCSSGELEQMSTNDFRERIHKEDRPAFQRYFEQLLRGETPKEPAEYRWRLPNGAYRWFSDSRGSLKDENGRVVALVGVSRDITARKQEEQAGEKLREELEVRVAERTRELKDRADQLARLTSELTLTEQRERGRLAQVLHDHLQQLLVGAKYALVLVTRRVTGEEKAGLEQVEQLINESIDASRSLTVELSPPILHEGGLAAGLRWLGRWAEQKFGLAVALEIDEETVVGREDVRILVFHAVRELLMNVSKYAGVSEVFLQLAKHGQDQLRVTVQDHGSGFDPAQITSRGRALAGGFGLFSIRERLGLLGGELEIESAPGQGTRITLTAPVREKAAPPSPEEPVLPHPVLAPPNGKKPATFRPAEDGRISLLLVDDHAVMRQGLSSLLTAETDLAIIGEASDGQEAVEMAETLKPDVILMDFSMPRLDGVQATHIISKQQPQVRIIGLSMYAEDDRAEEMLRAGASGYVTKSGKSEILLHTIRQVAAQKRS